MKAAPITTAPTLTTPPDSAVPPMTAAAIACNSMPTPSVGRPTPARIVISTPARPAKPPQMA